MKKQGVNYTKLSFCKVASLKIILTFLNMWIITKYQTCIFLSFFYYSRIEFKGNENVLLEIKKVYMNFKYFQLKLLIYYTFSLKIVEAVINSLKIYWN